MNETLGSTRQTWWPSTMTIETQVAPTYNNLQGTMDGSVKLGGGQSSVWEWQCRGGDLLKMRLIGAGVDFDAMLNSMPGGQVQGVEHWIIEKPQITSQPQWVQVGDVLLPSPHPCSFQWYHNYLPLHHTVLAECGCDQPLPSPMLIPVPQLPPSSPYSSC